MAPPLEFKRRVRLAEAGEEPRPKRQRAHGLALGAAVWALVVGLAVGISEGLVPVEHWLQAAVVGAPERVAEAAATPHRELPPAFVRATTPLAARTEAAPDEPLGASLSEQNAPPEIPPTPEPATPTPELATPPEPAIQTEPSPPPPEPIPPPAETSPTERRPAPARVASAGKSCEEAAAEAVQEIEIGARAGAPDLAREDYASILDRGSYFAGCGAPDSMRIDICAAVRSGWAVGVTVRTEPGSRDVAQCIARAVRSLAFPSHPRLDVVRTSFAPGR